jgi:type IV pilus assembly protein PilE
MQGKTGFSLLELLIVMALIAILAAISYPLYTSHLVRARRNQAEVALLYLASQLESYYTLQSTYQGASVSALGVNPYTDGHFYQLSIQTATATGYIIAATPFNQQAREDPSCASLFLNELGEKTVSGSKPADLCW